MLQKTLKLFVYGAIIVASLFSFSAFTLTSSAHAEQTMQATRAGSITTATSDTTISPLACPATVSYGDSGSTVKLAQESLNYFFWETNFGDWATAHDIYRLPVLEDGQFGANTKQAVKDFQAWDYPVAGSVDGVVGPKTWHALGHC